MTLIKKIENIDYVQEVTRSGFWIYICRMRSALARNRVVSADYRMYPQAVYPAFILDADSALALKKIKKSKEHCSFDFFGPSVEIRTRGLLNPIQARYQTSPHPDFACVFSTPEYISTH